MSGLIKPSRSQVRKRLTKEDLFIEEQYTENVNKRQITICLLTTVILTLPLIVLVVMLWGFNRISDPTWLISALLLFARSLIHIIVNAVFLKRETSIKELITFFNGKKL